MQTNSTAADSILGALKEHAKRIAGMPNTFKMCEARAIAFVVLSSAIGLCALYLADFLAKNNTTAARKYLSMVTRVSESAALLSASSELRPVILALMSLQRDLIKAHGEFQLHCRALAAAYDDESAQA